MRIQCDACEKNLATVMCCTEESALCADCDARIHKVVEKKHVRVSLLTALEPTKCDICQEKRGFFFCLEDRALLCRDCDVSIHTANTLSCNHKRFLVTGTRASLEVMEDEHIAASDAPASEFCSSVPSPACSSMSSQSSHFSRASTLSSPTSTLQGPRNPSSCQTSSLKTSAVPAAATSVYRAPTVSSFCPPPSFNVPEMKMTHGGHQEFVAPQMTSIPSMGTQQQQAAVGGVAAPAMRKSSISEFLTDAVPGWRVDEFLNFADCTEGFNSTDFASAKVDGVTAVGGDYDWTADLSLFEEQMFAMHEVPQFPFHETQLAAPPRMRTPRHVRSRVNRNHQELYDLPNAYNDAFIVPEIRAPSAPVSLSLPKRVKRDLYHMSNH